MKSTLKSAAAFALAAALSAGAASSAFAEIRMSAVAENNIESSHKITALFVEYPENVVVPSAGTAAYTVVDYVVAKSNSAAEKADFARADVAAVYTNSEPAVRADKTSVDGKYMVVELENHHTLEWDFEKNLWHLETPAMASLRYSKDNSPYNSNCTVFRTDYSDLVITQVVDVCNAEGKVVAEAGVLPSLTREAVSSPLGEKFKKLELNSSAGYPIYAQYYVPETYDASRTYPMLFFVSGGSQRLNFFEEQPINEGAQVTRDYFCTSWLRDYPDDIIILTVQPQNGVPASYKESYDEFRDNAEAIRYMLDTYSVDANRVIAVGSSYGTLSISPTIQQYPELIKAYVQCNGNWVGASNMFIDEVDKPCMPYTDDYLKPEAEYYDQFKAALQCVVDNNITIWVCHGYHDGTAPVTRGITTYKMLHKMYEEMGKSEEEIDKVLKISLFEDEEYLKRSLTTFHDAYKLAATMPEFREWVMNFGK